MRILLQDLNTPFVQAIQKSWCDRATRGDAHQLRKFVIDSRACGIGIGVGGEQCYTSPDQGVEDTSRFGESAHPYEEPAFDIVELQTTESLDTAYGLGRVGTLPEPMRLADFVQQVADNLPATEWGVRATGDPEQMISTVAVSSGSGDSFLNDVTKLGVDVYVTSDLRHHPVDEYLRAGGPAVVDTAHWASEFPWTTQVQEILNDKIPELNVEILTIRTDPWTMAAKPTNPA